jgi:hypothetical protein
LVATTTEVKGHVRANAHVGRQSTAETTAAIAGSDSSGCLALTTIEPREGHPGAAAPAVVLDQEPRADALHPHLAFASVIAAVVLDGDRVALWRDMCLEGAIMEIARRGNQYSRIDVQPSAVLRLDFDKSAAHIASTLAPSADPVRCLR